jgi:ankyrin repeat protein
MKKTSIFKDHGYICPISLGAPWVPVLTNEGITYDFASIAQSLLRENTDNINSVLDPFTHGAIDTLIYNRSTKELNDALMGEEKVLTLSHDKKTEVASLYAQLTRRYPALKIYGIHTLEGMQALIGAPVPVVQMLPQPAVIAESLWDAACDGHLPAVMTALAAGANPNQVNTHDSTPLLIAAKNGSLPIVTALLAAGAAPNQAMTDDLTPLLAAAHKGHSTIVTALLAAGAAPNQAMTDGTTPLLAAAHKGHSTIVTALLAAGAIPNQAETGGTTPLLIAVQNGHSTIVTALLAAGAAPNQAMTGGTTPLLIAAQKGCLPIVTALLAAGAIPNQADTGGTTPLLVAARNGYLPIVAALLAAGAIPNQADTNGITPLLIAAQMGHLPIVAALLATDPRMRQNQAIMTDGTTQLYIAILFGHLDVTKALLGHQMATITDHWLYVVAAENGYQTLVRALLSDATIRDHYLNQIIKNPEFMRDSLRQNADFFTELAKHRNELWARLCGPQHFNLPPDEHEALLSAILNSRQVPDEALHHPLYALFSAPLAPQPKNLFSWFSRPTNITLDNIQAYTNATYPQPTPPLN